jgi:outer membrane receptor protein involved in Fe transport
MNLGDIRSTLIASASVCAVAVATPATAQTKSFNVPAQAASTGIPAFASQADIQILVSESATRGKRTRAVKGRMSVDAALKRLVAGSGLRIASGDGRTYTLASDGSSRRSGGPVAQAPLTRVDEAAGGESSAGPEIIVTGSRIARPITDTIAPITAVSSVDMETASATELSEILIDFPAVNSSTNLTNGRDLISASGLSSINLRGLGSNRTLILIDGRRAVSNNLESNSVSTSTIPAFFVDRVEIITGGASAIYGSDAIAGVVNVITPTKFKGLKLGARYGSSIVDGGGRETMTFSALAGTKFLDDRGSVIVGATYEKDLGLFVRDRERARRSIEYRADTNMINSPALSSSTPGGRFVGNSFFYDETGLRRNFVTAQNGFETRTDPAGVSLSLPREIKTLAGKFDFEISDSLDFFAQAQYSNVFSDSFRGAVTVSNTTIFGLLDERTVGRIPRNNPFVPAAIRAAASSSGVTFARRLSELGSRRVINERETLRAWAGFKGRLFGDWTWEASYGYGRFQQDQDRDNVINLERLQFALNAENDPAVPGGVRCVGAAARADGCVPINLFGIGSITPEAADYIRGNMKLKGVIRQDVVQAFATGSLFDLPGGPLSVAFGGEYRRDHQRQETDDLTRRNVASSSFVPEFSGSIKAKEGFLEIRAPILADVPFFHRLSLDGAIRLGDYNIRNVGRVFSYRVGGEWAPIDGLRFRGSLARSQRAPDITEVYSPSSDDADNVIDICDNVTATTPGVAATNCRSHPGIAAEIAATGSFQQDSTQIQGPSQGNPTLKEETGDTFTVGAVLTPKAIPGFSLTVDYFNIRVKDAISSLSNSSILEECYLDPGFPDNDFCKEITRNDDGQLVRILNRQLNLNLLTRSGLDVGLNYAFKAPNWLSDEGRFDFSLNYSRLLKDKLVFQGRDEVVTEDFKGEIGSWVNRGSARLGYRQGGFYVSWRTTYTGRAVDDLDRVAAAKAAGLTDPLFLYIGDRWRHDIYVSIEPEAIRDPRIKVYAGIRNLTNSVGPFLPTGTNSGSFTNYSGQYDVSGRSFYAGVELKF